MTITLVKVIFVAIICLLGCGFTAASFYNSPRMGFVVGCITGIIIAEIFTQKK